MIDSMFQSGSLPVLERLVEFTEQRQGVLADDAANLSTPNFLPRDLDTRSFQATLRDALDKRPNPNAPLQIQDTDQVESGPDGLVTHAKPANEGILFHDGNNRDLDRLMQHIAENNLAHNTGIQLIRNQLSVLRTAIQQG
jgi:flagellar basal-body rod protein FlgB